MLAIATTLATTSCDSIPSREERVANRIERQEARSAQRAEISANKMAHTVFQLNAYIDTYEDLVDKYNELVSRVEPGKKNSVLENNIRQLRHQIKDCENEINRLSTKYFKESYTASINQG
jgi:flagellar biosynthesis chaperone FliJ